MSKKDISTEIERRFLILNIPDIRYDTIIRIEQRYLEETVERIRKSQLFLKPRKPYYNYWLSDSSNFEYERTSKERIEGEEGVTETNEKISQAEYLKLSSLFKNCIHKIRHVKECKDNKGLSWELDDFSSHQIYPVNIMIAEIEIPSMSYDLTIPKWLEDSIVMEVTGENKLSNFYISKHKSGLYDLSEKNKK